MFISTRAIIVLGFLFLGYGAPSTKTSIPSGNQPRCRYLPNDSGWPNQAVWKQLNQTVGGKLIRGVPLGHPCYEPHLDIAECSRIQDEWTSLSLYESDPVNVMSPYWKNNSCSPFFGSNSSCSLGNLASYAINISNARDVINGLEFAKKNNIRLTIKNTGHDYLGRSAGAGSLALWTHNLDEITFLNYSSPLYTGPAYRIGAGVEYINLYPVAGADGYRVVGGTCPTVGIAGGYTQGGGHGPLGSAYGLGADQVLEWEVVTAAGKHITVSPLNEAELFWALSGGGGGNFAVVLSMTVRAHVDGPVAGASFSFNSNNDTAYWAAIGAWLETLLLFDTIDGLTTVWTTTTKEFSLAYLTLPDVTTTNSIDTALAPFFHELEKLNISVTDSYTANVLANFAEHYTYWFLKPFSSTLSVGNRLIPRSTVQDEAIGRPALINALRVLADGGTQMYGVSGNFKHGNYTPNAVLPAWRDALFMATFARDPGENGSWDEIRSEQAQLNLWQEELRNITPGGGNYMNEATWDNPHWKEDYFGSNYAALLAVKEKYDPDFLFWANAAVGSDLHWKVNGNGALCRV